MDDVLANPSKRQKLFYSTFNLLQRGSRRLHSGIFLLDKLPYVVDYSKSCRP